MIKHYHFALLFCLLAPAFLSAQSTMPKALQTVMEAHGGLQTWKQMKSLQYDIKRKNGNETHYIHLKNRKDRVDGIGFSLGWDGEKVWIKDEGKNFESDPVFYHNLMFYFYAMPFVLADPGIIYSETDALEFQGKTYPGIRISYKAEVGASPEDEYFIHYDPKTNKMAWLGYTVTYFSGKKSNEIKWIRYYDWKSVNGLMLPRSLSWYYTKNNKPTELKNTVQFEKIRVQQQAFAKNRFAIPEGAKIVE